MVETLQNQDYNLWQPYSRDYDGWLQKPSLFSPNIDIIEAKIFFWHDTPMIYISVEMFILPQDYSGWSPQYGHLSEIFWQQNRSVWRLSMVRLTWNLGGLYITISKMSLLRSWTVLLEDPFTNLIRYVENWRQFDNSSRWRADKGYYVKISSLCRWIISLMFYLIE